RRERESQDPLYECVTAVEQVNEMVSTFEAATPDCFERSRQTSDQGSRMRILQGDGRVYLAGSVHQPRQALRHPDHPLEDTRHLKKNGAICGADISLFLEVALTNLLHHVAAILRDAHEQVEAHASPAVECVDQRHEYEVQPLGEGHDE